MIKKINAIGLLSGIEIKKSNIFKNNGMQTQCMFFIPHRETKCELWEGIIRNSPI